MRFLREWMLHNWDLKLVALVVSFLLWTTYTAEPISEVGYQVPLEFNNVPKDVEISSDAPTEVQVRVRGRSALLRRLSRADLGIAVDLSGRRAGEMLVELTPDMVSAPYGATVVRISPSRVRVLLVPRRGPH
jgi:YbbR domain-containing protein